MFAFSGLSALSNLDIHLRDPLLRVLSRLNIFNIIGGGSKVVMNSLADFLSISISARDFEDSCLRVALFLRWFMVDFFELLLVSKGPLFSWGSKVLGGIAPRQRAMYWEVFYFPPCLVVQWQRRSIGITTLLYDGLNLVSVFPLHSIEEGIIK